MTTCPKYALFFVRGQGFVWFCHKLAAPPAVVSFNHFWISAADAMPRKLMRVSIFVKFTTSAINSHPIRPPLVLRVGASSG
jgi:hypothetical protein